MPWMYVIHGRHDISEAFAENQEVVTKTIGGLSGDQADTVSGGFERDKGCSYE